jgi:hypothetical protein
MLILKIIMLYLRIVTGIIFLMLIGKISLPGDGLYAQTSGNQNTLSVFLDIPGSIDADFIRQEIPVVQYVRDRAQGDVHIIMSQHPSGTAGIMYHISFIGRGIYQDKNYQLSYWAPATNTSDQTRRSYTEKIKTGLAPFIASSPVADMMIISYSTISLGIDNGIFADPWNYWVMELYGGGNYSREETRNSLHIRYGIFADRITPEVKTRLRPYGNYYERNFITDQGTITSTSVRGGFDSYHIKSLADHWGIGVFGNIFISTFHNLNFSGEVTPAIEYSLFPYAEATRRSIAIAWRFGLGYYDYVEETIFDKTEEFLFGQALVLSADFRQPWGNIRTSLVGFHHFHDLRSNRTELSGIFNLRIVEGLSLNLTSSFNLINDLVAIPKADMSLEQILLEQRRRASSYEFAANIGLAYTFGSRITGVFNPRLNR